MKKARLHPSTGIADFVPHCWPALFVLQDTLDETLPDTLHMTGIYLMILLTSLAIVTVSIYYYAIMTGALFMAFAMMQYLYLPAATLLKRWAGDTASTLFVHVDESLQGMDVIRAFDAVNYFIQVRRCVATKAPPRGPASTSGCGSRLGVHSPTRNACIVCTQKARWHTPQAWCVSSA
jgi:hypothetical protein